MTSDGTNVSELAKRINEYTSHNWQLNFCRVQNCALPPPKFCGPVRLNTSNMPKAGPAVYRLTIFCCVPEIFAIKSGSCLKSRQKFIALGNEANFIKSYRFRSPTHHRTCGKVWYRLTERPQTRRLGAEKINIISMD